MIFIVKYYGHPGNIGHEYIAEEYFNSIKLYYRY